MTTDNLPVLRPKGVVATYQPPTSHTPPPARPQPKTIASVWGMFGLALVIGPFLVLMLALVTDH